MFPCPFGNILLAACSMQLSVRGRDPPRTSRSLLFGGAEPRHAHLDFILPPMGSLKVILHQLYRPSMLAIRDRLIRTASLHQPTVTPYPCAALQRVYTFMREWIISPSGSLGWCARAAASSQVRLSNRSPSILCLIVPGTSVHIYNSMISLPSFARFLAFHVQA